MNYCSIQDAWGSNSAGNQITEYMANIETAQAAPEPIKEIITQTVKPRVKAVNINNTDTCNVDDCNDIIKHIKSCKRCQTKIKQMFKKPTVIEQLSGLIDENKDTVVLVLMGISILLFINLINSSNK